MSRRGTMRAFTPQVAEGNLLALWIQSRYQGQEWFDKLAKRWHTSSRAVRFFVQGQRWLPAQVLYLIAIDTDIRMETMIEQCMKTTKIKKR